MNSRHTDNITRVDVRLPNHLYDRISQIAISHFHAKVHHRSNKPEVSPTILQLIEIGIANLESTLPATDNISSTEELKGQIEQLDTRLKAVEAKLSGVEINLVEPETIKEESEEGLTDSELSDVLGVSSVLIRKFRVDGRKPPGKSLMEKLKEWEIKGDRWLRRK